MTSLRHYRRAATTVRAMPYRLVATSVSPRHYRAAATTVRRTHYRQTLTIVRSPHDFLTANGRAGFACHATPEPLIRRQRLSDPRLLGTTAPTVTRLRHEDQPPPTAP